MTARSAVAPGWTPRARLRRACLALLAAVLWLPAVTSTTSSGLVAATSNTGNQVATAASFAWKPVPASATTSATSPVNASTTASAWTPRLADVGGTPWVVWSETAGAVRQVRVKRWDGTAWQAVGVHLNQDTGADGRQPSITSVGGVPYVAWAENTGTSRIRVSRWTGSAWQPLLVNSGTAWNLDTQRNAYRPRLTAVGTTLWVVWQENDSADAYPQVKFRSYNTVNLTAGSSGVANTDAARAAVDPDVAVVGGKPWAVFSQLLDATVSTIRVRDLSGVTLVAPPGTVSAYGPSLAVGTDGVPHLAFRETGTGCWRVRTFRWSGSAWAETGPGGVAPATCTVASFGGGTAQYPDAVTNIGDPAIAVVGTTPWLAWSERNASGGVDVVVARYAASMNAWVRTSVLDVGTTSDAVTPHVVGSGGRGYAALTEWDGAAWEVRVAGS